MRCWLGMIIAILCVGSAWAVPITRPLGESGGWSTVEQVPAVNAPPDSCMIVQLESAVALRSIGDTVDLMVANAHWDLPSGMQGAVHVSLRAGAESFPVTATTRDTAAARIDAAALSALLNAMSHEGYMRVTLFPGMPVIVPLAGFAAVLPAFRHCAGLS
jgi:hypothetical protein